MITLKDELTKAFDALLDNYQKEHAVCVVFKDTYMGLYPHIYPWETFLDAFGSREYTIICGYLEDKDTMPPIDIFGLSEDGSGWVMTQDNSYYSDLQYKRWKTAHFTGDFDSDKEKVIMHIFNEFEKSSCKSLETLKKYQINSRHNEAFLQLQNTIKESENIKFNPSTDFINNSQSFMDSMQKHKDDFIDNFVRGNHIVKNI